MNMNHLRALVGQTFQAPKQAATEILGLNFSREVQYLMLCLVAALNTILFSLSILAVPSAVDLPGFYDTPLVLWLLMFGCFVLVIHATYWAGLAMGGRAQLGDLIALFTWLQAIQIGVQLAQLVLLVVLPGLASVLSLVVSVWLLWITVNFIAVAFQFDNLWRAVGVFVAAILGLALGLALLLTLIGVTAGGITGNV